MGGSNEVYMYEEKQSNVQVVGKFFAGNDRKDSHVSEKYQRMEQEFHNLAHDARLWIGRLSTRRRTPSWLQWLVEQPVG